MGETGKPAVDFHGESDLIQCVFAPLAAGVEGAYGLIDDAALMVTRPGEETVLTSDISIAGVHFLADGRAGDIGYRALAVNVSDLVAKGAIPHVYLLSIALPGKPSRAWLEDLAAGLADAQADFGCGLAGGDTVATPGLLTLSITALGHLPEGTMLLRSGARPGDRVYVTGTIGNSAAALKALQQGNTFGAGALNSADLAFLSSRYWRPSPDPKLTGALRDHASAAMDVSDGLAGDFAKLCAASGCGGTIEAARIPLSRPVRALLDANFITIETVLSGGDDYEVLATVPADRCAAFEAAAAGAGTSVTEIGAVSEGDSALVLGKDGQPVPLSRPAFDHF